MFFLIQDEEENSRIGSQ